MSDAEEKPVDEKADGDAASAIDTDEGSLKSPGEILDVTDESEGSPEVEPSAEDKLATLEEELKNEKDKALRLQAEMVNFKNRQEKLRLTWNQINTKELVIKFLEPFDNLERAIEAVENDQQQEGQNSEERLGSLVEGVKMVIGQFAEALSKSQVETINPQGEKFDPNLHEAFSQVETSEVPEGHVASVFRRGYKIQEQCIRTAMVQVAKAPAKEGDEAK